MNITRSVLLTLIITCLATSARTQQPNPTVTPLPEVTVTVNQLREEAPVGPYEQPEWTTARRFPTTRVYLQQPPWGFGVEQWLKAQFPHNGSPNYLYQEEIEIGLPYRFQFDVYDNWVRNDSGTVYQDGVQTEVRWAVADWGKIPLNPTLYAEWNFREHDQGPNAYELKLLLGEDLAPRWHWAFNVIYEQEVGGNRRTEMGLSQGLSYTLLDERFSAGIEMKLETANEAGDRNSKPIEFDIGPSFQWRPTPNTHLDIVPLFGVNDHSPRVEAYVIFGIDFGPGDDRVANAPASARGR